MSNPDVLACAAELSAMPDVGDLREAPAWRASLLTDARKWRCSSAQISSPQAREAQGYDDPFSLSPNRCLAMTKCHKDPFVTPLLELV